MEHEISHLTAEKHRNKLLAVGAQERLLRANRTPKAKTASAKRALVPVLAVVRHVLWSPWPGR